MNSLPLISHRLFVAAIGNQSRALERPRLPDKPAPAIAGHAPLVAVLAAEQLQAAIQGGFNRPFQTSAARARV